MRFDLLVSLAALSSVVSANDIAAVYRLTSKLGQNTQGQTPVLSQNDAVLNLADEFGVSGFYDLNKLDDENALSVGKSNDFFLEDQELHETKLVLIINGVDNPEEFFIQEDITPTFKVSKPKNEIKNQFKEFIVEFPKNIMNIRSNLKLNKLSSEIVLLAEENLHSLKSLWSQYFNVDLDKESNAKMSGFWESIKDSFHSKSLSTSSVSEESHNIDKRVLNFINDKSFISELTQLDYFLSDSSTSEGSKNVIINLQSLTSIFKKTGINSGSYKMSKKLVSDLIAKHLQREDSNYDATVIVLPIDQQIVNLKFKEVEHQQQLLRQQPISLARRDDSDSVFASSASCFATQELCTSSTLSCSGHGVCAKSGKCWRCSCSATVDEDSGKTTYWTGSDCAKKDVSVEFNLFLWTGIALLFAFVAGVKLLASCGNEELPGILVAATLPKKSAN